MAGRCFIFRFADVEVREREFSLTKAGERLSVEPKAFRVLLILLRNPGKLIPKQELLDAVWGDAAVTENSLARAVALLRKLLGDEARTPKFIETVATVGYRFLGNVEAVEDPSGATTPSDPASPGPDVDEKSMRAWKALTLYGAAAAVLLGGAFWYLSRPLPPPRITAYTQITHDGRDKGLGGTDGNRVYFTESSPNVIVQVGIGGGEIALLDIAVPGIAPNLMDISPDGSHALVRSLEEGQTVATVWVVPLLGGAAKRLEDSQGESFSADGTSVIYSTPNGDIFTVHIDGSDKRKLAGGGSYATRFASSPDGKVIRFSKADGLWEMSSDGTGSHRLLPDWKKGIPCCGDWTRDGGLFLFWGDNQIWALDERRSLFRRQSSIPIQLTTGPIRWSRPLPGRDGKTIFARGATPPRGELTRIDRKSGNSNPFLDGISAEMVSFSPDGKLVAYVAFPEGTLWKANRDGRNRMQLTTPSSYQVVNPRWSPDSNQILFTTLDPQGHVAIHRISSVDGSPQWLLPEDSAEMGDANWSPDGKRILFNRDLLNGPPEKEDLRILDLNSRQITTIPGSTGLESPRWSPDGRYVIALVYSHTELRVFDFKTQRWVVLPTGGDVEFPSFSRDGRYIYFLRDGRDQGVFRIPVTVGKLERVVDMTNWHLTGCFRFSMSLDPTDAPLVLRDVPSNDIYSLTLER